MSTRRNAAHRRKQIASRRPPPTPGASESPPPARAPRLVQATLGQSILFSGPRRVEVVDTRLGEIPELCVRVSVEYSAISAGTELRQYRTMEPCEEGGLAESASFAVEDPRRAPDTDGRASVAIRPGYAAVGRVVGVGASLDPRWRGRRVFAFAPHASHFDAPPSALLPIPDSLPDKRALFLANAETAMCLVHALRPLHDERVVVFGLGVVGGLACALLAEQPLASLLGVDPDATRREAAAARMSKHTGQLRWACPQEPLAEDADAALEVTGRPEALEQAVRAVGHGGRVVVGSWYPPDQPGPRLSTHFHRSHIEILSAQVSRIPAAISARWTKERRFASVWRFLERFPADRWITHRFDIHQAADAYAMLDRGTTGTLQVILSYR